VDPLGLSPQNFVVIFFKVLFWTVQKCWRWVRLPFSKYWLQKLQVSTSSPEDFFSDKILGWVPGVCPKNFEMLIWKFADFIFIAQKSIWKFVIFTFKAPRFSCKIWQASCLLFRKKFWSYNYGVATSKCYPCFTYLYRLSARHLGNGSLLISARCWRCVLGISLAELSLLWEVAPYFLTVPPLSILQSFLPIYDTIVFTSVLIRHQVSAHLNSLAVTSLL
jgi:hypothetical protein